MHGMHGLCRGQRRAVQDELLRGAIVCRRRLQSSGGTHARLAHADRGRNSRTARRRTRRSRRGISPDIRAVAEFRLGIRADEAKGERRWQPPCLLFWCSLGYNCRHEHAPMLWGRKIAQSKSFALQEGGRALPNQTQCFHQLGHADTVGKVALDTPFAGAEILRKQSPEPGRG